MAAATRATWSWPCSSATSSRAGAGTPAAAATTTQSSPTSRTSPIKSHVQPRRHLHCGHASAVPSTTSSLSVTAT